MAATKVLSDKSIAEIRRRFVGGEPKKTIAHNMGVDRETVQNCTAFRRPPAPGGQLDLWTR